MVVVVVLIVLGSIGDDVRTSPADDAALGSPSSITVASTGSAGASTSTAASTPVLSTASTHGATDTTGVSVTTPDPPPSSTLADDALAVLRAIAVEPENDSGYDRALFPHWIDGDGDGCTTREEVLIAETRSLPQVDPFGCRVVAGDWYSPYDGVVTSDPGEIQIDHVVALNEAWGSGAWRWSADRRRAFANDLADPRTLIAVTGTSNQSKSDRDPASWMPPNRADHCRYAADWTAIKARWGLSMDRFEWDTLTALFAGPCAGTRITPWPPA